MRFTILPLTIALGVWGVYASTGINLAKAFAALYLGMY